MKQTVAWLLTHYGEAVTILAEGADEAVQVQAFFQPVTGKSLQNMRGSYTGLGELPPGQYLYLGPAETSVQRGDRLGWNDRLFDVRQAEDICIGDTVLYRWGLAAPGGEEDPWNA